MLTESKKQLYNATIKIVHRDTTKMIFRVYADTVKMKYLAGQYGALGLYSDHPRIDHVASLKQSEPVLIKRAYSISSPIIDDQNRLIDSDNTDYYEFYIDVVLKSDEEKLRLSPRLFTLKDNDRIFLGPKIVGHYTAKTQTPQTNALLISTTTGESPHNAIIGDILKKNEGVKICNIVVGDRDWVSAYQKKHEQLMKLYSNYRYIAFNASQGYAGLEKEVEGWLKDQKKSEMQVGWAVTAENSHIFLCGDPLMIGAPAKLGAWNYEYPDYGLMRLLEQHKFKAATRFQAGNISYESYW